MLNFSLKEQLKKSPQQLLKDLLGTEKFKDSIAQEILILLSTENKQTETANFVEYIKKISNSGLEIRRRFWAVMLQLDLTAEMKSLIKEKLQTSEEINLGQEVSSEELTSKERLQKTVIEARLPFGNLPIMETYLKSASEFSIMPMGVALKINGLPNNINLSPKITGAILYTFEKIKENLEKNKSLEEQYKLEKGLPKDSVLAEKKSDIIAYFIKKILADEVKETVWKILRKEYPDLNIADFEIEDLRFKQLKQASTFKELQKFEELGKRELNEFFSGAISREQSKIVEVLNDTPAEMIPLHNIFPFLDAEGIKFKEIADPNPELLNFKRIKTTEKSIVPNELQQKFWLISNATKTGKWTNEITKLYVKYMDYFPQYLEHRAAVLDLISKYKKGLIKNLPQVILSVASGPHEELRAHYDIAKRFPDYKMPEHIISADYSLDMLANSRETLPQDIKNQGHDILADMKHTPIADNCIDLVECSSFDNLKGPSSENDVKNMLVDMVRMAKTGGLLRFSTNQPFTSEFYNVLAKNNISVLEKSAIPTLDKDTQNQIEEKLGESHRQRALTKLGRLKYFLAKIDKKVNLEKLAADLNNITVFQIKEKITPTQVIKEVKKSAEKEGGLDQRYMEYVAQNPIGFLNKGLDPKNLQYCLLKLKGNVSVEVAQNIYKEFFKERNSEKLAAFAPLVLDILTSLPETTKLNFPISLLKHKNPEVQEFMRKKVLANFTNYAENLLILDIATEEKAKLFSQIKIGAEIKETIENYIKKLTQDIKTNQDKLLEVLSLLPTTPKLDLPIVLRYAPKKLSSYYFNLSKNNPEEDKLNLPEILQLFSLTTKFKQEKINNLEQAISVAEKSHDREFIISLFYFLDANSQDEQVIKLIGVHKSKLNDLFVKLSDTITSDPGFVHRIFRFRTEILGEKMDQEKQDKLLRKMVGEQYEELVNKVSKPGVDQFDTDNLDKLIKQISKTHNLSKPKILILLLQYKRSSNNDWEEWEVYRIGKKRKDTTKKHTFARIAYDHIILSICRELTDGEEIKKLLTGKVDIINALISRQYTVSGKELLKFLALNCKSEYALPRILTTLAKVTKLGAEQGFLTELIDKNFFALKAIIEVDPSLLSDENQKKQRILHYLEKAANINFKSPERINKLDEILSQYPNFLKNEAFGRLIAEKNPEIFFKFADKVDEETQIAIMEKILFHHGVPVSGGDNYVYKIEQFLKARPDLLDVPQIKTSLKEKISYYKDLLLPQLTDEEKREVVITYIKFGTASTASIEIFNDLIARNKELLADQQLLQAVRRYNFSLLIPYLKDLPAQIGATNLEDIIIKKIQDLSESDIKKILEIKPEYLSNRNIIGEIAYHHFALALGITKDKEIQKKIILSVKEYLIHPEMLDLESFLKSNPKICDDLEIMNKLADLSFSLALKYLKYLTPEDQKRFLKEALAGRGTNSRLIMENVKGIILEDAAEVRKMAKKDFDSAIVYINMLFDDANSQAELREIIKENFDKTSQLEKLLNYNSSWLQNPDNLQFFEKLVEKNPNFGLPLVEATKQKRLIFTELNSLKDLRQIDEILKKQDEIKDLISKGTDLGKDQEFIIALANRNFNIASPWLRNLPLEKQLEIIRNKLKNLKKREGQLAEVIRDKSLSAKEITFLTELAGIFKNELENHINHFLNSEVFEKLGEAENFEEAKEFAQIYFPLTGKFLQHHVKNHPQEVKQILEAKLNEFTPVVLEILTLVDSDVEAFTKNLLNDQTFMKNLIGANEKIDYGDNNYVKRILAGQLPPNRQIVRNGEYFNENALILLNRLNLNSFPIEDISILDAGAEVKVSWYKIFVPNSKIPTLFFNAETPEARKNWELILEKDEKNNGRGVIARIRLKGNVNIPR
ncbi:MAG: hypothetical protein NTZ49_00255 [Candidatus Parcubacteria bacterium]|nr:hypothetical protein [Candidatus Parcubacteria bacterium]